MNRIEQKIIKLEKMIRYVYCKVKNLTNIHNEFDGLQGGQEGQYYHLTEEQYNNIDNVELTDEKVQITETTDFAQIGQNQKDFNKNVSDYKGVVDSNINGLQTALNNKQDRLQDVTTNIGVGKTDDTATEKLDVNGNIKATQIKDQYGTLKSQRTITITGNTTLSETHNGAVLNVTNTCNITVPTGLDANFNCVIFAKGAIIVTFVNSGATIYAPSGLLLKQDKMASLICTSTNNFNLTGELATS